MSRTAAATVWFEGNTQFSDSYISLFILRKIDWLVLPKFSISTDYRLEGILQQLGIREFFSTQAELSGITDDKNLGGVSHVRQGTLGGSHWCLNVDGEGQVCGGWQMCEKACISEIPSSSER